MTPHTPVRLSLFAFLALALAVSACGGGGEDTAADTAAADAGVDAADAPPATGENLFDTGFAQVCRGTGQAAAAEYVAAPGVHPILLMQSRDGTEYTGTSATLPEGWAAAWPALERTELLGCLRTVSATPAGDVCEGYHDEDTNTSWTVQNHDMVYEYVVRNARTGAELGRQTFEVPGGDCPMFSMHSNTDPNPQPYYPPVPTGEAELFFRPFVTGAADAAPMSGQAPGA